MCFPEESVPVFDCPNDKLQVKYGWERDNTVYERKARRGDADVLQGKLEPVATSHLPTIGTLMR
jgi:hypothetical protein